MTKLIRATRSYKIFVAGVTVFVLLFSAVAFWLWAGGHLPSYVAWISVVIFLCFAGRYVAVTRFAAVEVCENELIVYGWFGGRSHIDLCTPIDMASTGSGIVLKQGSSGAGIDRHTIGKANFDEITKLLIDSVENIDR